MITVITDDARYDFEADTWTIDGRGQLDVTQAQLRVASFAHTKWHGVFATRQLAPGPGEDQPG